MTIDTHTPSVFDAALPTISYENAPDPEEAHRIIGQARRRSPIAMGPLWA